MAKFNRMYYYTAKGEKKLNCYNVAISKDIVELANLQDKELKITISSNKIIIEQK